MSVPDMKQLNGILWHERLLLEDLLFALEAEQWVRSAGRTRWLARVADDIDTAGARLRDAEVLRAVEADAVAAGLGLAPAPSLTELADRVGEPWRTILLEQRAVLRNAADDVLAAHGGVDACPDSGYPGWSSSRPAVAAGGG